MSIKKWLDARKMIVSDYDLIEQAFMHSSYVHEHRSESNNERLEFLGDAVLQLWVTRRIFMLQPPLPEGQMTTLRAQLVCEKTLAHYFRTLKLQPYLKLGSGEEKTGGRNRDSILADCFEAFLGALYFLGGMKNVEPILEEIITPALDNPQESIITDYKTKLQEYVQSDTRKTVTYEVIKISGPSNNPRFEIQVKLDEIILGVGSGNSKKKAEQMAAKNAFDKMVK